jgi:hypothetical protein
MLIGGNWNVTLAVQDRENHTEKRTVLAQQITALIGVYKLTDVWRRLHPDSNQFTYSGTQANNPKSRLDRLYISEQWLHLVASANICPYFADHAAVSLNIPSPVRPRCAAYWRLKNTLLNDKTLTSYIKTIIQYYSTSGTGSQNILAAWDDMKQEIRLQIQRYEDHLRRSKNSRYRELEQQISNLTEKTHLSDAEAQVLNTVGTTLRSKYQQDTKRQILRTKSERQHNNNNAQFPIFPFMTEYPSQQNKIQMIQINGITLSDQDEIRTEIRNYFKIFYSAKSNQPDIREDLFTNIPRLKDYEEEHSDAPLTLQGLSTALHNTNRSKSPRLDGLPYEFYKEFWGLLGLLLLEVATTSLQEGQLPSSMRNGVITLIPKKGDLTALSNWRPITLLNRDYKLITRFFIKQDIFSAPVSHYH